MKLIFLFIFLLPFTKIYGIEDTNDNNDVDDEDEEPLDLSAMGFGTDEYDQMKFLDLMMEQKQDPDKMLKIFRAILLKGYDADEIITTFKPVIHSALMDSYIPGQKEALRVIAVLAGKRVDHVEKDILEILIQKYMPSKDPDILLKTLTALSKILFEESYHRVWALPFKIDDQLLALISDDSLPLPILREITEIIKFLCLPADRFMTQKTSTKFTKLIEHFILLKDDDPIISINVVAGYYRLTKPPSKYQYYLSYDAVKKLIKFLSHKDDFLKFATLNVIEGIIDKQNQTEMLFENGIMEKMPSLLAETDIKVLEKALLVLAKLAAEYQDQTVAVFEDEIISKVVKAMYHEDLQTKNTAALVITFLVGRFKEAEIITLINAKAVHGLCYALKFFENEEPTAEALVSVYLVILKKAKSHVKQIYEILDECDGIRILYRLKKLPNKIISEHAVQIIETFERMKSKNVEL